MRLTARGVGCGGGDGAPPGRRRAVSARPSLHQQPNWRCTCTCIAGNAMSARCTGCRQRWGRGGGGKGTKREASWFAAALAHGPCPPTESMRDRRRSRDVDGDRRVPCHCPPTAPTLSAAPRWLVVGTAPGEVYLVFLAPQDQADIWGTRDGSAAYLRRGGETYSSRR